MSFQQPIFLTAEWRHLVMLNYFIDPAILKPLVPAGTELDFRNNQTYVSLVGFRFLNTKIRNVPVPCHRNFSEVNLRFYVRHRDGDEWRRAVVFIKEIVPLPAVTLIARRLYNENYVTLPMRQTLMQTFINHRRRQSLSYSWKWQGRWAELAAETEGDPEPLARGSEEEFIAEHYWGYTTQRNGSTMEYAVEHPPWQVWRATVSRFHGDATSLYGQEFAETLSRPPSSAFVADGSEVLIRKGTRLPKPSPIARTIPSSAKSH
ncbi:YqjF family protein [Schlesneria paludicola]|uniref:YqjF family protein n=1 Tax=Schlesneria paludicola TaxID=360056 RepID=UPI000299E991|nr:DUF2071 domain-containing protein [Schlesneria paludicola]